MRDFMKSMMSYTWAMSLFGVQQMVNVFRPSKATESFDNVTDATREEFGDALRATFRVGDNLQRGIVDLTFSVFSMGMFDGRGGGSRTASDVGRQSADAFRQGMRAMGQAADAVGQTVGWGGGGSGRCDDRDRYDRDRGGASRTTSDLGRQAADAVGQGVRAMGEAADAVGQTMQGAAYAAADAAQQGAGWAATPGMTRDRDDAAYRRADDSARRDTPRGRGDASRADATRADASRARGGGASGAQAQGWGPMPSQGSGTSRG
jgi:hypothetical protein